MFFLEWQRISPDLPGEEPLPLFVQEIFHSKVLSGAESRLPENDSIFFENLRFDQPEQSLGFPGTEESGFLFVSPGDQLEEEGMLRLVQVHRWFLLSPISSQRRKNGVKREIPFFRSKTGFTRFLRARD
jgi:hypothetical protein